MRLLLLILCFIHLSFSTLAQKCMAIEATQKASSVDSNYDKGLSDIQVMAENFSVGQISSADRGGHDEVEIPVVVHVLYSNDENNIGMDQIQSQIDVLNRDFNWENSDKIKVPSVWKDLGAASGFRFHLADKDPFGNFTSGVERKFTFTENIGSTDSYYKSAWGGLDPWNIDHYVNIWVCDIEGLTLGFSILPSSKLAENDGIVMDPIAFGTMGTATPPYNGGRTCVHEMGHYFGLRHIWGAADDNCTSTDYMSDTPWQFGPNYGCNDFPSISCASEEHGDMFMNYMDYGNDSCMLLFTKKQVGFMQLVYLTSRSTLMRSPAYTGINESSRIRINFYPNPATDELFISSTGLIDSELKLFDQLGSVVARFVITSDEFSIDISHVNSGFYTIRCGNESHQLVLLK